MDNAFALTSHDWLTMLTSSGFSSQVLPYFLQGLYGDPIHWQRHVSPKFLRFFAAHFTGQLPVIGQQQFAQDGTVKLQMQYTDGLEAETVLIPFHKRYSICLSTQIGCGMNCSFCFTGTQGLKRNLTAGEIVAQYLTAFQYLKLQDKALVKPAIVFMGQGEPLHNVDEVLQAVRVLTDPRILGLGPRQITLSTVGYLPAIPRLMEFPAINLALSLHSPFQEQRVKLIPIGRSFELAEVMQALDKIPLLKRQFINYEYLLIKNFNMSEEHVQGIHQLLAKRPAIINLIPFNPFPGSQWQRPQPTEVEDFRQKLVAKKLRVMVRTTKGSDILAACGQLKIAELARKHGIPT